MAETTSTSVGSRSCGKRRSARAGALQQRDGPAGGDRFVGEGDDGGDAEAAGDEQDVLGVACRGVAVAERAEQVMLSPGLRSESQAVPRPRTS